MHITREVLLDARPEEIWHALVDETARSEWLDDDRPIEVLHARPGQAVTWRWTAPDAHGVESVVELELTEADDGRTRLTVTERSSAAATCSLGEPTIDGWDRRLLGLELRCALRAGAPSLV
jgi:uncharacterized protein YndB with AHSA1/START domain